LAACSRDRTIHRVNALAEPTGLLVEQNYPDGRSRDLKPRTAFSFRGLPLP
jgi:hypothetical protein